MIGAATGALAAGAWLGPGLAVLAGLALQAVADASGHVFALLVVVAISLLVGAPAAALAALRGLPMPMPALGLACGLAAALSFGWFHGLDGLPLAQSVAASAATAALALLWGGLAVAAGLGLPPLAFLAIGGLAALALAFGLGGPAGLFWGLGLGAGLAGFPLVAAAAARGKHGALRLAGAGFAGPICAGLALALAVLAGPVAACLLDGPLMALILAPVVALPGLALVCLARGHAAFGLARWLLLLQACAVALGLAIGAAPAIAGLMTPQGLGDFRLALLGAGFLPGFAALQAVLLGRARLGPAICAALLLALVAGGVPLLAALVAPGLAPRMFGWCALAAPPLATLLAFLLVSRDAGEPG